MLSQQRSGEKFASFNLNRETQIFLDSLDTFAELLASYNFKVRTYSSSSVEKFLGLPKANQDQIIQDFSMYIQFLTECSSRGISLRDDKGLLKAFLARTGFIYDQGIFDTIGKDVVIEIYTKNMIQIYRNPAFMDLCSYTLLDLFSYDPYELYERSHKIKEYLIRAVDKLLDRSFNTGPIDVSDIPHHMIREKFSAEKLTSFVQFRLLYPLYAWPQSFEGFLVVQEGRNIKEVPAEIRFL